MLVFVLFIDLLILDIFVFMWDFLVFGYWLYKTLLLYEFFMDMIKFFLILFGFLIFFLGKFLVFLLVFVFFVELLLDFWGIDGLVFFRGELSVDDVFFNFREFFFKELRFEIFFFRVEGVFNRFFVLISFLLRGLILFIVVRVFFFFFVMRIVLILN